MRRWVGVLLLSLLLLGASRTTYADGPTWTPEQTNVIRLIYVYSDYYGLRDVDRDLMLRVAYRETGYRNVNGDCWGGVCHSVGPFQMFDAGVWLSTPQYKAYGMAGRYNVELNVAGAAYSFNQGRQSHWSPLLKVRWLAVVPSDPRLAVP